MKDAAPKTKGARRCTNRDASSAGRWIVGGMRSLKNGKSCFGEGYQTICEAREVIDRANEDCRLHVD